MMQATELILFGVIAATIMGTPAIHDAIYLYGPSHKAKPYFYFAWSDLYLFPKSKIEAAFVLIIELGHFRLNIQRLGAHPGPLIWFYWKHFDCRMFPPYEEYKRAYISYIRKKKPWLI